MQCSPQGLIHSVITSPWALTGWLQSFLAWCIYCPDTKRFSSLQLYQCCSENNGYFFLPTAMSFKLFQSSPLTTWPSSSLATGNDVHSSAWCLWMRTNACRTGDSPQRVGSRSEMGEFPPMRIFKTCVACIQQTHKFWSSKGNQIRKVLLQGRHSQESNVWIP